MITKHSVKSQTIYFLQGWLPKGLVDTAYPKAQLDYLENVRQHAKTLKSTRGT